MVWMSEDDVGVNQLVSVSRAVRARGMRIDCRDRNVSSLGRLGSPIPVVEVKVRVSERRVGGQRKWRSRKRGRL